MTDKVRRKDREITDKTIIEEFISKQNIIRIGYYDKKNEEVYIVPVNYGYIIENNKYIFYFHGGKGGRKYELSKDEPNVGFEIDGNYKLLEGKKACDYSAKYTSVIGNGKIKIIQEIEEKKKALDILLKNTTGQSNFEYNPRMVENVAIYKLIVSKLSCKGNL